MRAASSRAASRVRASARASRARPARVGEFANSRRRAIAPRARARASSRASLGDDGDVSSLATPTSRAPGADDAPSDARARDAEGHAATRRDDATTRDARGSTSRDDGDDDDGDDDDGGSNGRDGDGDGEGEGDGEDDASRAASWARADRRRARVAADGGALFAGVVSTMLAPVAWLVFRGIKPTRAEREKYAMETRESETLAKRRVERDDEAAKLAKRLDEAKEAARAKAAKTMRATGPAGAATATATATATNFKVEEKPKDVSAPAPEGAADERADASTRSDVGADVEDTAVISASTSSDETEATDAAVRVVSVNERSFETPESEAPVAPTPTVSHDVEPIVERHHADGEAYDVIAEHPKLVRAIHEANALVHKAHARRVESNQEFQDALRYREQVVHMASELGIPVAPLREVKETFKQSTYEAPLGPGAGEKAAEAAKSALAATKKFVDFAAPHVRSATTKAFDYSKQHATTAAGKLKQAHAKGDIRAPTLDEATDFAKSTSRRALGACVHAFDAITDQFAAVANKSAVKPQKS